MPQEEKSVLYFRHDSDAALAFVRWFERVFP